MREQLQEARRQTDSLFELVKPEALYDRPISERHRIIFYIGHLEAFDWNLLASSLGLNAFEAEFDRLFAFGIDPVERGLPQDTPGDWPSLSSVIAYRNKVRAKLNPVLPQADGQVLHVALEHRLMHAETLAYMFHQLPFDRKATREVKRNLDNSSPPITEAVEISAGFAKLGLARQSGLFGWDNEFEAHSVEIPAFSIDRHKVTNTQFLKFVVEGGYHHRAFWTDSDWQWITECGISHPAFWLKDGQSWGYRSMFDEIPLPPGWPVYVSHAEASAYCRWAGKVLPSEAQWHRASEGAAPPCSQDDLPWDPWPVQGVPSGCSVFGVEGMVGNGWEWTATPFAPFEGFRPFPFYPGYSADFFDGKHYVMKGGSVRTAASMLRPSFRNWFQSHYQYIYSGFRCVTGQGKGEGRP